ncbi:Gfo/Idh/MocA family oxidoreductase [Metabacillus idriensis]|uniref:Gfo/Idh/MocA family protein n=1 Tax=Metabacillus idriensis TaxID=324768 RepID=UPI0028145AAF|nr:Gfo/Idh/MocA family oxidoreductase [Metabacillus idriensis]MDR0139077.1 Gfo/Idh/MocA family oxidoreductase [Metabacillus idriensis]
MIRAAIIGLGAIGQRLITNFTDHPDIMISAICDRNAEVTRGTSERLENVSSFTDHKEMLEEAEIELVYVAVPPKFHHQIVTDVIAKGKHVLCEKPLANSLEEAESLYIQAKEKGIIHAMNFPLNYSAGSRTFASLIKEGYVGKLRRIELKMHFPEWPRPWQQNDWVASREQGGFVLEVGVHYIQQIQKSFGPVHVLNKSVQYPEDPAASEVGILAQMELHDGTPIFIDGMSQIAGTEEIRFTAYGTEGTLALLNWSALEGGKHGEPIQRIAADSSLANSLMDELVKALKGEEAEIIDFEAGYQAQDVLEKLRGQEGLMNNEK